jgi:serine/threonine-protein kinase RsbW
MTNEPVTECRVLIVEDDEEGRVNLSRALEALGHRTVATTERDEALARQDFDQFDLIISDLSTAPDAENEVIRSFKMGAASDKIRREPAVLHDIIHRTLSVRLQRIDKGADRVQHVREKIDLELPSDLSLMNIVLEYLLDRVAGLGMIQVEQSNLFVALDEAFVNAVKHGNRNDPTKLLRVTAELSPREAAFTVEDEGDGFDVREIPDPCDAANLFKSNGRGVLLIYNIMDEVEYSRGGAKLKMVKRPNGVRSAS